MLTRPLDLRITRPIVRAQVHLLHALQQLRLLMIALGIMATWGPHGTRIS